ncbi:MAG TPA: phosphate-starvation-inducible PsiE family protein [Gammaproteobacteria bacterium]|nr:phosphate-starvation-inducible PsiE family protein [Gammaproteobacteria bacterium]
MSSNTKLSRFVENIGDYLVEGFHLVALFVIGGTIVWSALYQYIDIVRQGHASLQDILILFIYLELGAMVGIYFKTNRLPVRFLLYIGITVLTRSLVVDVEADESHILLIITSAILMLALAIVVLGYGSSRFSSDEVDVRQENIKVK